MKPPKPEVIECVPVFYEDGTIVYESVPPETIVMKTSLNTSKEYRRMPLTATAAGLREQYMYDYPIPNWKPRK